MGRINWFPGHMAKAMATLNRIIKGVDLVLEVRDARIPLSSANPKLSNLLKGKRHIVVLNKVDLVNRGSRQAALHCLERQGLLAMPASTSSPGTVKKLLNAAVGWISRERAESDLSIMMVVGLPNSGKSSLINALKLAAKSAGVLDGRQAYQRRAAVGMTPGLTRQVSGFQVCAQPATYVLDTPGIMVPAVPNDEVGLKLALAGAIKDSVVGEEAILRFYLHLLSSNPKHLAALKASAHLASNSSGSARGGSHRTAAQRQDGRLQQLRSALIATAGSPAAAAAAATTDGLPAANRNCHVGSTLLHQHGMSQGDEMDWHPGQEDVSYDVNDMLLEILMQKMGFAGASDPSMQLGCCIRALQAFRAGDLGQCMLDDLE